LKWKHATPKILTTLLLLFFLLTVTLKHAQAEDLIAYGSNFQILAGKDGTIAFQHPDVEYVTLGDTITLTITNGTLNGTSATLKMYQTSGTLTFTNQNTTTITLTALNNSTAFWINTAKTNIGTLTAGNTYTIQWSILEPELWLPLMFILGMFGLGSTFAGPLYAIHLLKKNEYRDALVNGTLITALGIALTIAWLWA
jgi:hypothetical protein